jgi:hypothetical protein
MVPRRGFERAHAIPIRSRAQLARDGDAESGDARCTSGQRSRFDSSEIARRASAKSRTVVAHRMRPRSQGSLNEHGAEVVSPRVPTHPRAEGRTLYTIGHSTRPVAEMIAIFHAWEITRVVDIRAIPRSRTNPQFNLDVLPETLGAARIKYVHLAALGGRRRKSDSERESVNAGWEHRSFQNYADYAQTAPFRDGLRELLEMAATETCAIMCAEAVWWRCHRRIVTDHVLAHGVPVVHLFSIEKGEPASLTPFAELGARFSVSYPAP